MGTGSSRQGDTLDLEIRLEMVLRSVRAKAVRSFKKCFTVFEGEIVQCEGSNIFCYS